VGGLLAPWVQEQDVVAMTGSGPYSKLTSKKHWHDLMVMLLAPFLSNHDGMNILRGSALLQNTTGLSLFSFAPKISWNCSAKRYRWPMWSGPKS